MEFNGKQYYASDWFGGHIAGTIFRQGTELAYTARIQNTSLDRVYSKRFGFSTNGGQEQALINAKDWQCTMSESLKMTKNKMKNINNQYLIVQLSKGYITLVDIRWYQVIQNIPLFVLRSSHKESKYYVGCMYEKKLRRFHHIITGYSYVDHQDRFPLDNRLENLRKSSPIENDQNRTHIYKSKLPQNQFVD